MTPRRRTLDQLGTGADWRHRLPFHHAPLAVASALVLVLFLTLPPFDAGAYPAGDIRTGTFPQQMGGDRAGRMGDGEMRMMHGSLLGFSMQQWTTGTGYVATGLLGLTLLIGPANLLLRRRNPVSSYLTRDVGTWTAIFSVVHVIFGFQVHGSGQIRAMLGYFVRDGIPLVTSFGLGNWTGLAATVLVVLLLAISNDAALRELKGRRWKDLQRLNYTLFALVILHIFFYGALLRLTSPYTLLGVFIVVAVVLGQAVGVWSWRRRRSARTAATAA